MTPASPPHAARAPAQTRDRSNGYANGNGRATTSGLFEGYRPGRYADAFDEMFVCVSPTKGISSALAPIDVADLEVGDRVVVLTRLA
ncbi:hypothetical protein ACW2Q0_25045 [Nocardia sp. R16R-3T]